MNILSNKIKRRDFLRNLARAGMVLPFASQFMLMNKANAMAGGAHRYIQIVYPNGCDLGRWHSYSLGQLNENSFSAPLCPLKALDRHMSNLLLFNDLSSEGQGGGGNHKDPAGMIMSGGWGGAETIESVIGRHLHNSNQQTAYFGIDAVGGLQMLRTGQNQDAKSSEQPQTYFDNNLSNKGTPGDPDPDTERRKAVLELLDENLDLLRGNTLNDQQRNKLALYNDSLDFYRTVLDRDIDTTGFIRPDINTWEDNSVDGELIVQAHMRNIAMGMSVDIFRSAGFQFMTSEKNTLRLNFPSVSAEWLGEYAFGQPNAGHDENRSHSTSHGAGNEGPKGQVLNGQTYWYNQMVAYLVDQLKERSDPVFDGSLFDNTVIMLMSENAHGNGHGSTEHGTYVLAGDNTGVNTGRAISTGRGTANLMLELSRLFGRPDGDFGNAGGNGINGFRS